MLEIGRVLGDKKPPRRTTTESQSGTLALMKTAALSHERLEQLVAQFPTRRIAVVGDFFLDKYLEIDTQLEEVSVETGKPCHQVVNVRTSPGAAGTVVSNLSALRAGTLHAVGFSGDDGEGFDLRQALARVGCSTDHLHVAAARHTPTYLKPRNLGDPTLAAEHSRYDTKNRTATPPEIAEKIITSLTDLISNIDALVVMDQVEERDCGAMTAAVRDAVIAHAKRSPGVIFWADSRRRIGEYHRVIVKPNEFEVVGEENPTPGSAVSGSDIEGAARALRERNEAPIVVTLGADGMIVSDPDWTRVPGVRVDGEIDPTGAGDSATAGTVLALSCGATLPEAAVVGNLVASLTVQQIGTTGTASPDSLAPQLEIWRQQNAC